MKEMLSSIEEYTVHLQQELQQDEIVASKLVAKILEENVTDIYESGLQVSVAIDQPINWISDEYCNYTILQHVIKNAIAFRHEAKPAKKISISIAVDKTCVGIRIEDNGVGISSQQQTELFEPFHKGATGKTGFGLGLFLVKGLINKLRANISVSSQENIGTIVSILIPNNI